MLWLIICHEREVTTLYVVSCECDSFRGVPNCCGSVTNCVGLVECGLSLVSRVDVSPECALRRVVRAVLPSVHSDVFCIFIVINMHIVYDMYMNL